LLCPIDKAISTVQSRFEQFKIYEDIFCFLFSLKTKVIRLYIFEIKMIKPWKKSLKHDNLLDIDGFDLFPKL